MKTKPTAPRPLRRPRGAPRPVALRLYVAGASPNSLAAIANLKAIALGLGGPGFEVELVDVLREPERGLLTRSSSRPPW